MPLLNWTDGTTGTTATPTWWTTTTTSTTSSTTNIYLTSGTTCWFEETVYEPPLRRSQAAYWNRVMLAEQAQRMAANDQESRLPPWQQRFEEQLQAGEQREAARIEADAKATALLLANLNEQQRRTYKENGWFTVEGGVTRERYRLRSRQGLAGNIDVMHGTRVAHRLCAHGPSDIPMADQLLAQKLHLELDEESFLRVANRHPARTW